MRSRSIYPGLFSRLEGSYTLHVRFQFHMVQTHPSLTRPRTNYNVVLVHTIEIIILYTQAF